MEMTGMRPPCPNNRPRWMMEKPLFLTFLALFSALWAITSFAQGSEEAELASSYGNPDIVEIATGSKMPIARAPAVVGPSGQPHRPRPCSPPAPWRNRDVRRAAPRRAVCCARLRGPPHHPPPGGVGGGAGGDTGGGLGWGRGGVGAGAATGAGAGVPHRRPGGGACPKNPHPPPGRLQRARVV